MSGRTRPDGWKCVLAQAALSTLKEKERHEREMAFGSMLAPALRGVAHGAIRLIDLERRARFARLAS